MSSLNVNTFKAKLKGGGARPNLFRVTINFPSYVDKVDSETVSVLVKAASLPPSQLGEILVPYRGRQIPLPGDRTFEPWEVTIYNDTDFAIRDALVQWSQGINNHAENTSTIDPVDYYADLKVEQLGKKGESLKSYVIRDAFPMLVGQIDLANDRNDEIEEFQTTFRYLLWE